MTSWRKVRAEVRPGYRVASGSSIVDPRFNAEGGTIRLQLAGFRAHGCDFERYFGGPADVAFRCATLGLSVAPSTARLARPEVQITGLRWTERFDIPGQPPFRENFYLSRAWVNHAGTLYRALLYLPDPATKPAHQQHSSTIEVVAAPIAGIDYFSRVELLFPSVALDIDPDTSEPAPDITDPGNPVTPTGDRHDV